MHDRCEHCPIALDQRCLGTTERFHHMCEAARSGDPDRIRYVVERSAIGDTQPPSLASRAVSFVSAVVGHVAAGLPQASEEDKAKRLAICQACENYDGGGCRACGCPGAGLAMKLGWADGRCPIEPPKWGPVEPAT
jgi:hypothetical protein